MPNDIPPITIEGTQIMYRNFAGAESAFNGKGDRNFCVPLDAETAARLANDGWNVRMTKIREEGDEPIPYLPVKVSFKIRPPRVVLVTPNSRVQLNEDQLEVLDYADIASVDLIANGSRWEMNGKSGIKAYLKTMFVIIQEDELEQKYKINELENAELA